MRTLKDISGIIGIQAKPYLIHNTAIYTTINDILDNFIDWNKPTNYAISYSGTIVFYVKSKDNYQGMIIGKGGIEDIDCNQDELKELFGNNICNLYEFKFGYFTASISKTFSNFQDCFNFLNNNNFNNHFIQDKNDYYYKLQNNRVYIIREKIEVIASKSVESFLKLEDNQFNEITLYCE